MKFSHLLLLSPLILLAFPASPASAFDCTQASRPTEKLICTDPLLVQLDDALNHNYQQMLNADISDGAKIDLKTSQRAWLIRRNACRDKNCISSLYRQRNEEICEYPVITGVHPICDLPNGQRQRIAIARALITNPGILIFDEATSALDYESEKIIQDNMRQICAGRTVLIIAHRLSAVRDAHRIIVMDKGQIVESGSHDELLKQAHGLYAHLYGLQTTQGSPRAAMGENA